VTRPRQRLVLAVLAGILFSGLLFLSGLAEGLDQKLYDLIARGSASADRGLENAASRRSRGGQAESGVELVYIDQYSLGWVEENLGISWPWPRELYGILASFGSRAKVQVFDILFSETSSFGPDDDARCAKAMAEAGNVVVAEAVDSRSGQGLSILPAERIGHGRVAGLVDRDGVLRRYDVREGGEGGPASLGRAALAMGGDSFAGFPSGSAYLRFSGASPSFPARNAAELLSSAISLREGSEPQVDPEEYKGTYLFIGFSAPGLLDRQAVPTDRAMPGAEIHATFVDNALRGRLLDRLPPVFELALILLFALGAAWVSSFAKGPLPLTVGMAFFALLPAGTAFLLYRAGLVASAGLGSSVGISTYAAGIILSYVSEGRNKAFLRRSFSQYLAPSVIERLLADPCLLSLGGEERCISVFFSDIQDFTSMSESMTAERLAEFMNSYFAIVTGEILKEGGTVDKYVGDAVVAFWNAPLDQEDHAARAVRAALNCQNALAAAESLFASQGAAYSLTRIGIHTGRAIVGNMGSPSRFNYTAMGDAVNTASRLENANKSIGTRILVSGDTVGSCASAPGGSPPELGFRRLGGILVHGKMTPIEVWEPRFAAAAGDDAPVGGIQAWEGLKDCRKV